MDNKATMTVENLATELNLSKSSAYQLTREDGFPTVRVGGRVLISTEGFKDWLKRKEGNKTND